MSTTQDVKEAYQHIS